MEDFEEKTRRVEGDLEYGRFDYESEGEEAAFSESALSASPRSLLESSESSRGARRGGDDSTLEELRRPARPEARGGPPLSGGGWPTRRDERLRREERSWVQQRTAPAVARREASEQPERPSRSPRRAARDRDRGRGRDRDRLRSGDPQRLRPDAEFPRRSSPLLLAT